MRVQETTNIWRENMLQAKKWHAQSHSVLNDKKYLNTFLQIELNCTQCRLYYRTSHHNGNSFLAPTHAKPYQLSAELHQTNATHTGILPRTNMIIGWLMYFKLKLFPTKPPHLLISHVQFVAQQHITVIAMIGQWRMLGKLGVQQAAWYNPHRIQAL